MLGSRGPRLGGVLSLSLLLLLSLVSRPDRVSSILQRDVDDGCISYGVVAVHLVPKTTNEEENPGVDRLFRWRCPSLREPMAPCRIELVNHSRLRILCAGMYFLYSQLAYKMNSSSSMVGHNTVLFKSNGAAVDVSKPRVLVSTAVTPTHRACEVVSKCGCFQTSYHGGVFFLAKDEEVAVMPFDDYMNKADFCLGQTEMFLGAWLIQPLAQTTNNGRWP